jgi:beta-alanine--pyruvate transaminase
MQLTANSLEHLWMPFTANREFKASPRLCTHGEGVYYRSHRGERILDASSGLFCVAAGHGRPEIADAVHRQLLELDYCPPFQLGHPAQFELARRIAALTPEGIDRVIFGNSGSEAIETAIKIALAYHRARGEGTRTRMVSRERAYHGVNMGGVSLSGMVKNRDIFSVCMPYIVNMRHTWRPEDRFTRGQAENGEELANDLQRFADTYGGHTIAACFVEPVAGSTGVLVPPTGYLERLREICNEHGILLIFDEVITGFGRLGAPFAAAYFAVQPDIVTLAKALTNGTVPMGAVAVRDEIFDTFMAGPEGAIEFTHGYTWSGHPLACAAARAALMLYQRDGLLTRVSDLAAHWESAVHGLRGLPQVIDIRNIGLTAAVELAPVSGQPGMRGMRALQHAFKSGAFLRVFGDTICLAPPLIITPDQIDELLALVAEAVQEGGLL